MKLNKVIASTALLAAAAAMMVSPPTSVLAQGYNVVSDEGGEALYASADTNENVAKLNLLSIGWKDIYGFSQNQLVVQDSDSYIYEAFSGYKTGYKINNGESQYLSQSIHCLDNNIIAATESMVRYQGAKYFDLDKKQVIGVEFNYPEGMSKSDEYDYQGVAYNDKMHIYIVTCDENGLIKNCLFDENGNYIETKASYLYGHAKIFFDYFFDKEQMIGKDSEGNYYIYDQNGERRLDVDLSGYNINPLVVNGKVQLKKHVGNNVYNYNYYMLDTNTGEISFITNITSGTYIIAGDYAELPNIMGNSLVLNCTIYNESGESYAIKDAKKGDSVEVCGEVKKYYRVRSADGSYYTDAHGNTYGKEYKEVGKFVNGKAIVLDSDNNAYVIDENFNRVSTMIPSVEDIGVISDGYYKVKIDGLYYGASFDYVHETFMITGSDGKKYWYEDGVKQGTEGRGKEIYDPESDAWYWLDAIQDGAVAVNKDVYQESYAGAFADREDGTGKWVRYDENGHMVKGWNEKDGNRYYFDLVTGAMAKGKTDIDGVSYYFDLTTGIYMGLYQEGFVQERGKMYWYEDGVKQGTEGRGKEIYDPESDAWYWLDAIQDGAVAVNKDVYQESYAGAFADREDGTGKWVRYDENGHMVKGWNEKDGNRYYFDPVTGAMAKGTVEIDGNTYIFDWINGILQN